MCMYRHLGTTCCKDNLSLLFFLPHSYRSCLDFLFAVLLIYLSVQSLDDHSFIIRLEAGQCQGSSLVLLQCCQPSLNLGPFWHILEPFHQHPQFTCQALGQDSSERADRAVKRGYLTVWHHLVLEHGVFTFMSLFHHISVALFI